MPCSHIKLPDGTVAIVKHARRRYPICQFCKGDWDGEHFGEFGEIRRPATLLCDFVLSKTLGGGWITCDTPVCEKCAKEVAPDTHYCPKHEGAKTP